MILKQALDRVWAPVLHKIEQRVAGQQIPSLDQWKDIHRKTLDEAVRGSTSSEASSSFDHSLWDSVLKDHVDTSPDNAIVPKEDDKITGMHLVDYHGIAKDDRFAKYLEALGSEISDPASLSDTEQVAFWMNAYNALCVNLIATQPELPASINDLSSKESAVWNQVAGRVAGKDVSLNHVEHEQLRKPWAIPQVHACIVCASGSCPNLRAEAYSGDPSTLTSQFQDQMRDWMKNPTKGIHWDKSSNRLFLSRIFLWFEKDFGSTPAEVRKFLEPYVDPADVDLLSALRSSRTPIRYFKYNWDLNDIRNKHN